MVAKITRDVLKVIVPSREEKAAEEKMAHSLLRQIKSTKGPHLGAILAGSIARDTHLRGDRDLDIFVFYPPTLARDKFEAAGLKLGHAIFGKNFHEEAYSEHPYVRGEINGFNVEIVPTYKVSHASEKISAVDRTPFHAAYMKKNLSEKQCNEVRLLKQFFKGISVYGADVRYQGVPGYLVEILILHYGSFEHALNALAGWKDNTVIDLEKAYTTEKEALAQFSNPFLLVVDPTDPSRNVAAALSYNQFARLILASRTFLKKPSLDFFFGHTEKGLSLPQIKSHLQYEEWVGIRFPYPKGMLSDVAWGQLHRLAGKLQNAMEGHTFNVVRRWGWTDAQDSVFILFEIENPILSPSRVRIGPKVVEQKHADAFLSAHKKPLSGPRVENGKIVLEVPRPIFKMGDALKVETQRVVQSEKDELKKSLAKFQLVTEATLLSAAKKDPLFARELSVFLKGNEFFL